MSSIVLSVGMLTVLEIAPLMKGCAAPIIFKWARYSMLRWPRYGLEGQSKTGRSAGFKPVGGGWLPARDVFNGVVFLSVRDDVLDFLAAVAQPPQRFGHCAVHD